MSVAASTAITLGVTAGTAAAGVYAARQQGATASRGTRAESQAAGQALKFQAEQAAENRRQFDLTQAENARRADQERADLLAERTYQHDQTTQRQQRVAPYTGLGLGALAQLRQPIYGPSGGTNTLANLMQRRG